MCVFGLCTAEDNNNLRDMNFTPFKPPRLLLLHTTYSSTVQHYCVSSHMAFTLAFTPYCLALSTNCSPSHVFMTMCRSFLKVSVSPLTSELLYCDIIGQWQNHKVVLWFLQSKCILHMQSITKLQNWKCGIAREF